VKDVFLFLAKLVLIYGGGCGIIWLILTFVPWVWGIILVIVFIVGFVWFIGAMGEDRI
jgi:hypothetical protein